MNVKKFMAIALASVVLLAMVPALAGATPISSKDVGVKCGSKAPIASFTSAVKCCKAPCTIQFKDKSKNTPTSWKWNFGDGTISTKKNPIHTYKKTGTYKVTLTVKNNKGCDSVTKCIYVKCNCKC